MAPSEYRLVDVSMWMDAFVFPGDNPVTIEGPFDFVGTSNPEWVYQFTSPTQAATHIQGPHYFLEHGATIDSFPLNRFEGWTYVVDIEANGADTTAAELETGLGSAHLDGNFVLFRTHHMDTLVSGVPLDAATRPGLSVDAAQWLIDRGVTLVAIDSVGVESRSSENFDVNVLLCQNDVLILEGLVNLDSIPDRVWLEAFPLKLRGVEGTPCRAVVKIPC